MATVKKRRWKTADGKERIAFRVDFVDSNGVRQRKQFRTSADANAFRVDVEGKLRAGTFRAGADKMTVRELADLYLEHCKGRMERGERFTRRHLKMVKGRIENYICAGGRNEPAPQGVRRSKPFTQGVAAFTLLRLMPDQVDDFRDRLRSAGVSVATTRKIVGTLHAMLEYAIRKNFVAVNAARGCRVIGTRDEGSKKIVPPTKEALRLLIEAADEDFRVKLIFAASTGLRAGELHALRWRHVNLDAGEVKVETRVDAYNEEDAPKTRDSVRTVPLGSSVVAMLRKWKLRSKWSKADDLVFPNRRGTYVRHGHMLTSKFYPLFEKLAEKHTEDPAAHPPAPARFGWHALRHYAVSTWIEAGLQPKVVQTYAGHATMAMTLSVYGHMFASPDHKKAMDAIAKGLLS
jgi:integrase